ncbi:hypothetical protein KJ633_03415, partial [bacterium]|nr:hypothetical protein [bacterium]
MLKKTARCILFMMLSAGCATIGTKETGIQTLRKAENIIRMDGKAYKVLTMKDEVKPEDIEYDVEVQFEEGISKDEIAATIKKYQGEVVYTIPERRLYMVRFSDGETADIKQNELEKEPAVTYFGINPFKGIDVIYAEKRLRVKFKAEITDGEIRAIVNKYGTKIAAKDK